MYYPFFAEELEAIATELELDTTDVDFDRLEAYISLVFSYVADQDPKQKIREDLPKLIEWERESFYGEHESPEAFARFYYENYDTENRIPSYAVVDWQATWDSNLRHDFTYDRGYVWAEVY